MSTEKNKAAELYKEAFEHSVKAYYGIYDLGHIGESGDELEEARGLLDKAAAILYQLSKQAHAKAAQDAI